METLQQAASLASGSTLAMTFMLPVDLVDPKDRLGYEMSERGARQSGTPFISFFAPADIMAMAHKAGFREVRHVSASDLAERYLSDRTDNLRSFLSEAENFLVARA